MEIYPLIDPYAIHYDSFAGDVYTLDTAGITLTTGTLTADTLTDGVGSITGGVGSGFTSFTIGNLSFSGGQVLCTSGDLALDSENGVLSLDTATVTWGNNGVTDLILNFDTDTSDETLTYARATGFLSFSSTFQATTLTDSTLSITGGALTTTGKGTFGDLDVDTLNLNGNVISDSTGTVSFDDDHLLTTGNISGRGITASQNVIVGTNYLFIAPNAVIEIRMGNAKTQYKLLYTGGGWARGLIDFTDDDNVLLCQFGAYGSGQNLTFMYIGLAYNDTNIKWYPGSKTRIDLYPLEFLDNIQAKFGTTNTDLQIYSDGTNGIIDVATALRLGNGTTNYTTINATGDMSFAGSAGFYPRFLTQAAEPAAGTGATQCDTSEAVIWKDSDDNKVRLCFNDGGTIKKVELV